MLATGSFVALSGQLALDARMSTLAHNIANARTMGFRAGGVNFNPITSDTSKFETVFASTGRNHVNLSSGGLTRTGNPLDVAVQGDGFFAYMSPSGQYYSRDGRLEMTEAGGLVNVQGHPVLDVGGAQITLDPTGGAISLSKDGAIYQGGARAGQLGLFKISTQTGFSRAEGSGLVPVAEAEPIVEFGENGIVSGFIEESNVNPINEMVSLIKVTRAFQAASTFADKILESEMEAIKTLGSR
jgi:flagellar basal-body rod protein FlgF